jgi:Ca2+-binding RTX toxin-like protein
LDTLVNIENLDGSDFNDTLTGNAGANVLNGGALHDVLFGGDGNDILIGGSGTDFYYGGAGNDVIIAGGPGTFGDHDDMTGGTGADRFTFLSTDPALINSFTVNDFSSVEGDLIDISAVLGDLTGTFIGTAAFSGVAGQLRVQTGFATLVHIDLNGDSLTDYSIAVGSGGFGGGTALFESDFIF